MSYCKRSAVKHDLQKKHFQVLSDDSARYLVYNVSSIDINQARRQYFMGRKTNQLTFLDTEPPTA
jgi:hypothetical protein